MNIGALKEVVASEPELADRCFLVSASFGKGSTIKHILHQVFGETSISTVEEMSSNIYLVTLQDAAERDEMLAKVHTITLNNGNHTNSSPANGIRPKADSRTRQSRCHLTIHPILPLPARVQVKVKGVPQLLVTKYKSEFLQAVDDFLPNLEDWGVAVTKGGHHVNSVWVSAVTLDLLKTKDDLAGKAGKTFSFREFAGKLRYKSAGPVGGSGHFKPKLEEGLTYKGY